MSVATMSSIATANCKINDAGFCRRELSRTLKVGEILQLRKLVTPQQLQIALNVQRLGHHKFKLGEILIAQNLITELDLQKVLMEQAWRKHGFWVID